MNSSNAEYETTRRAWSRIWTDTDLQQELNTRHYARSRATRERFVPYLPPGELVLEAGCGLGVEMVALRERGFRLVGVDYALAALSRLKQFEGGARVAGADVHALPFADGVFGAYLSFGVLEHFRFGPERALGEANRVLRPGGILVLTIPAPNLVWRAVTLRNRLRPPQPQVEEHYFETTYSARDLAGRVGRAGFEVVVCDPISHEFVWWGLGGPFRAQGHYQASRLAVRLGALMARTLPEAMSAATLIVARKAVPR